MCPGACMRCQFVPFASRSMICGPRKKLPGASRAWRYHRLGNGAHCATIGGDWLESLGKPDTNKEKHIWLIRERKIKARRNNKKRPNSIQRKNENRKEKRKEKDQTPGRRTRLSIFLPFEKETSRFASKVRHLWCVKKTSAGGGGREPSSPLGGLHFAPSGSSSFRGEGGSNSPGKADPVCLRAFRSSRISRVADRPTASLGD